MAGLLVPTYCCLEVGLQSGHKRKGYRGTGPCVPGTSPTVRTWGCPEKEPGIRGTVRYSGSQHRERRFGGIC